MHLSPRTQLIWWGCFLSLLFLLLVVLGNVLTPFLVGSALAYLLDPVADRLERWKFSRFWATATISAVCLLFVIIVMMVLIPLLLEQLGQLLQVIPDMATAMQKSVKGLVERFAPALLERQTEIWKTLQNFGSVIEKISLTVVSQAFSLGQGAVNFFLFILVVPVVMIYMLADWDRALAKIDGWLPRDHAGEIRRLAGEVDAALAGFVRGQLTVCAIVALFYAIALEILGLRFGFTVGFVAGFLSFIPFVGAIGGGALAVGLATFQFWSDPLWILAVAAVFGAGQILEGNFLTPRLVGKSVGLHPVWLLLALSAFGSLFGFVGLLVAVPAAATIGVFSRYALERYLSSAIYRGSGASDGR